VIDIERKVMRQRKKLVTVSRFEGPNYFEALRVRVLVILLLLHVEGPRDRPARCRSDADLARQRISASLVPFYL
jgi:hypothetical protein